MRPGKVFVQGSASLRQVAWYLWDTEGMDGGRKDALKPEASLPVSLSQTRGTVCDSCRITFPFWYHPALKVFWLPGQSESSAAVVVVILREMDAAISSQLSSQGTVMHLQPPSC